MRRILIEFLKNRREEGFSLLELVVAVGIMMTLTTGAAMGYQSVRKNTRIAFTNTVAAEVFTKAVANKNDQSSGTTPFSAAQEYYATKGNDHITILLLEENSKPVTILAINDAITMRDTGYFYTAYKSEKSADEAKALVDEAIRDCIAADGCNNVPRFQESPKD